MQVVAVILDRDDRVLEVGGNRFERHVAALFVEPEPGPPGGVVEHGVADAAIQLVDRPGVPARPHDRHHHGRDDDAAADGQEPVAQRDGAQV